MINYLVQKIDLLSHLNPNNFKKCIKEFFLNGFFFLLPTALRAILSAFKLSFDLFCQMLCEMIFRTAQCDVNLH